MLYPVRGQIWHARGWWYRIDHVADGQVYYCRGRSGETEGDRLCRISMETWIREMAEGILAVGGERDGGRLA